MFETFESLMTAAELEIWHSLNSPALIQAFLDNEVQYPATDRNRCPLNVLRDRQGHCLDGALFAAAALRKLGFPARLLDMFPDPGMDDDHVLAVYQVNGGYGSLAKSNFVTLRSRQPVYRSRRELVMSYFDGFFNVNGLRTLRSYTPLLDLEAFDAANWLWQDSGADAIEQRLLKLRRTRLLTAQAAAILENTDPLTYKAGTLVTNLAGLYKPK